MDWVRNLYLNEVRVFDDKNFELCGDCQKKEFENRLRGMLEPDLCMDCFWEAALVL